SVGSERRKRAGVRPDWGGAGYQARRFRGEKSKSVGILALLRSGELRLPVHRDIARLVRDAREPSADRRKPAEIKIRLVGDVGVSVKRDIGDREMVCDEKPMPRQVGFQ